MGKPDKELFKILCLAAKSREESLSPAQRLQLVKMLSGSSAAREYYTQILDLYADLELLFRRHSV